MTATARALLAPTLLVLVLLIVALLAAPVPAAAQAEGPPWLDELTRQMFAEHDCLVDFYLQIEESERDGQPVASARVHCEDQRLFDATRVGEAGRFTVERCATEGSRAC